MAMYFHFYFGGGNFKLLEYGLDNFFLRFYDVMVEYIASWCLLGDVL